MPQKPIIIVSYAAGLFFLCVPVSHGADGVGSPATNPPFMACADEPGSTTAALDCDHLKRRTGDTRASGERSLVGAPMAACTHSLDSKGNLVYDDPTCPTRYSWAASPESVYLTKQSAFFNRYIQKATKHAGEAEIAGNRGESPELLRHAQLSLDNAIEAQRAGNVPGLNEGIVSLREALRLPETSSIREARAYVRDARRNLSEAGGIRFVEIRPNPAVAATR